jgi:hypothetical protein
MKNNQLTTIFIFVMIATLFTGCQVIGDIFQAGVWVGVIVVVLVIVIIFWLFRKLMG